MHVSLPEAILPLRCTQVTAGQCLTVVRPEPGNESFAQLPDCLVARLKGLIRRMPAEGQIDRQHRTRQRTTRTGRSGQSATEPGGDGRNQLAMHIKRFRHRRQNAFRAVESRAEQLAAALYRFGHAAPSACVMCSSTPRASNQISRSPTSFAASSTASRASASPMWVPPV